MYASISFDDISPSYYRVEQMDELLNSLNELNIKCTFFVIPDWLTEEKIHNYKSYINVLNKIIDSGHEVAQHGYEHKGNNYVSEFGSLIPLLNPSTLEQEEKIIKGKNNIMEILGIKPQGFRAPQYLHTNALFKILSKHEYVYDSSKTIFKPAYIHKMRMRVLKNIKPFKIHNIVEIPVTGDYTYNTKINETSILIQNAIKDIDLIKKHNSFFIINNHPNHVGNDKVIKFIKILLKNIDEEISFLRMDEISKKYLEGLLI